MLIAADTSVLLDLAKDVEAMRDALDTIRQRLSDARLVAPPTVLHELALALRDDDAHMRKAALRALAELRAWGFEPLNLRAGRTWHRRESRGRNPAPGFAAHGGNERFAHHRGGGLVAMRDAAKQRCALARRGLPAAHATLARVRHGRTGHRHTARDCAKILPLSGACSASSAHLPATCSGMRLRAPRRR